MTEIATERREAPKSGLGLTAQLPCKEPSTRSRRSTTTSMSLVSQTVCAPYQTEFDLHRTSSDQILQADAALYQLTTCGISVINISTAEAGLE